MTINEEAIKVDGALAFAALTVGVWAGPHGRRHRCRVRLERIASGHPT